MAKLEFFVVSKSSAVDQATNELSIFEIIEEVQVLDFPASLPNCAITSLWRSEQEDRNKDFQVLVRITTPAGSEHNFTSNFKMETSRHRVTTRLQGLPIDGEGQIRFEALLNGEHAAEHIVDVAKFEGAVDAVGSAASSA